MFTFDDLWRSFLSVYKTEDSNLPTTPDTIYALIENAVRYYNNKMPIQLTVDIPTEKITGSDDVDNTLIILAAILKLQMLENEHVYYTTLYQPFNSDNGIRNYQTNVLARQRSISAQELKVNELIFNLGGDWDF